MNYANNKSNMLTVDEFWQYAVEKYEHEEVKNACLRLQDYSHANVNLLLLTMCLVNRQLSISPELLIYLQKGIQTLNNQIQVHRKKRRGLKVEGAERYTEALAQELRMEKVIQGALLDALSNRNCPKGDDSSFSLCVEKYVASLGEVMALNESDIRAISILEANILQ